MRFSCSSASDIQIYTHIHIYRYTHMIHQAQVLEVSSMRGLFLSSNRGNLRRKHRGIIPCGNPRV